jgi:hypothetical protein
MNVLTWIVRHGCWWRVEGRIRRRFSVSIKSRESCDHINEEMKIEMDVMLDEERLVKDLSSLMIASFAIRETRPPKKFPAPSRHGGKLDLWLTRKWL